MTEQPPCEVRVPVHNSTTYPTWSFYSGREEEAIVLVFWPGNYIDYVRIPELVTRARGKFILATSDGVFQQKLRYMKHLRKNPLVQMLQSAVKHFKKAKCDGGFGQECPYLGQRIVEDRFAIFDEDRGAFRLAPSK